MKIQKVLPITQHNKAFTKSIFQQITAYKLDVNIIIQYYINKTINLFYDFLSDYKKKRGENLRRITHIA